MGKIDVGRVKLVALDLDGTLTQHKSALDTVCRETLERLSARYRLLMVCAGGCERVYNQMGAFPIDIAGWYGMQFSTVRNGRFVLGQSSSSSPADKETIRARAGALRRELGFTQYAGGSVEFHSSGMITFPLLGTNAQLEEKLLFDPDRKKRRAYRCRVGEVFPEYTAFIGGTSSFDIVPRPFCKLYALDAWLLKSGLLRSEAIYFGDDYGQGGNDEDLFSSDIKCVRIDDYREFTETARELLL